MHRLNLDSIDNANIYTYLLSRLAQPKSFKWKTLRKSHEALILLLLNFLSLFEFLILCKTLSKSQTNHLWVNTYFDRTYVGMSGV